MELSVTQREQSFSGSVAVRAMNRNLWLMIFGPWSLGDMSKRPYGMQSYFRELNADRFERLLRRALGEDEWQHLTHPSVHDDKTHKDMHADEHDDVRKIKRFRDPHRYYDALWSWMQARSEDDPYVGTSVWDSLDSIEVCGIDCDDPQQVEEILLWLEHFRESIPDVLVVHDKNVFEEMARSAHASLTSLGSLRTPFYEDFNEHMGVYHPMLKKKPN